MIHIPPEVQAAAGIPAAQALQCGFSCFCYAVRREHFAQAKLVRRLLFVASNAFDPYPLILLNLVLSCVAAIQAPLIMMSQNRQEEKDRRRAENDYKVNLKTEIMIEDLYDKVNAILAKQSALEKKLQEQEDQTKS